MVWTIHEIWHELSISWGDYADFKEVADIYNGVMVIVCVICAGLAAGLTVGLLSLDETKLEIKMMTGTPSEIAAATRILPIIKQHHLLLVTLLLFNSLANETLPIFLGSLVPNYLAVIISVTLVLIFGEIIPSALFTGPNQLLSAARMTGLVYLLFIIFYPIALPISLILDYWFGVEESGNAYSRSELEALVILQGNNERYQSVPPTLRRYRSINDLESQQSSESMALLPLKSANNDQEPHNHSHNNNQTPRKNANESLTSHEINLMTGILKLSKVKVKDAMIPMHQVFMISSSTRLNEKSLYDILDSGFSRIPVFQRHDKQFLLGYLLVKELIVINPLDNLMIEDIQLREPVCVPSSIGLMELLAIFQEGQCHLAIVSDSPHATLHNLRTRQRPQQDEEKIIGIVTMEDVLEKIMQSEILDETDEIGGQQNPYSIVHSKIYPHGGAPTLLYYHSTTGRQQQRLTLQAKRQRRLEQAKQRSGGGYYGTGYGSDELSTSYGSSYHHQNHGHGHRRSDEAYLHEQQQQLEANRRRKTRLISPESVITTGYSNNNINSNANSAVSSRANSAKSNLNSNNDNSSNKNNRDRVHVMKSQLYADLLLVDHSTPSSPIAAATAADNAEEEAVDGEQEEKITEEAAQGLRANNHSSQSLSSAKQQHHNRSRGGGGSSRKHQNPNQTIIPMNMHMMQIKHKGISSSDDNDNENECTQDNDVFVDDDSDEDYYEDEPEEEVAVEEAEEGEDSRIPSIPNRLFLNSRHQTPYKHDDNDAYDGDNSPLVLSHKGSGYQQHQKYSAYPPYPQ